MILSIFVSSDNLNAVVWKIAAFKLLAVVEEGSIVGAGGVIAWRMRKWRELRRKSR